MSLKQIKDIISQLNAPNEVQLEALKVLINGVKDQEARIAKQEERIVKLEILVNLLLNGK